MYIIHTSRNQRFAFHISTSTASFKLVPAVRKSFTLLTADDDVELNVLGCRVDILGTNCDQCLSMVQCCFTSTETVRLIRTGEPRTATSTLTLLLNSDRDQLLPALCLSQFYHHCVIQTCTSSAYVIQTCTSPMHFKRLATLCHSNFYQRVGVDVKK